MGDVLGAPFELRYDNDLKAIKKFIDNLLVHGVSEAWCSLSLEAKLNYTDDSEMALGICDSLRRKDGFNEEDLAHTYVLLCSKICVPKPSAEYIT